MKRFLAIAGLVGMLLFVSAPMASAHGALVGPKVADCSAFHTVADSGYHTFDSGNVWVKARIERQYTPGGANCNAWRAVADVGSNTNIGVHYIQRDFCLSTSGLCGYYYNGQDWNFTGGGATWSFITAWVDLSYAPGCRWSARASLSGYASIYSPYTCV